MGLVPGLGAFLFVKSPLNLRLQDPHLEKVNGNDLLLAGRAGQDAVLGDVLVGHGGKGLDVHKVVPLGEPVGPTHGVGETQLHGRDDVGKAAAHVEGQGIHQAHGVAGGNGLFIAEPPGLADARGHADDVVDGNTRGGQEGVLADERQALQRLEILGADDFFEVLHGSKIVTVSKTGIVQAELLEADGEDHATDKVLVRIGVAGKDGLEVGGESLFVYSGPEDLGCHQRVRSADL